MWRASRRTILSYPFLRLTVRASTSDVANSSIYASIDSANPNWITLVALNKTGASLPALLQLARVPAGSTADVYQLTGASANPQYAGRVTITDPANFNCIMPACSGSTIRIVLPSGSNAAPTVVTPAAASSNPVLGTTTNLSVLGAGGADEPVGLGGLALADQPGVERQLQRRGRLPHRAVAGRQDVDADRHRRGQRPELLGDRVGGVHDLLLPRPRLHRLALLCLFERRRCPDETEDLTRTGTTGGIFGTTEEIALCTREAGDVAGPEQRHAKVRDDGDAPGSASRRFVP